MIRHKVPTRFLACCLIGLGAGLLTTPPASAGTFQSDFNSGIPSEIILNGSASTYDHSTGGAGNTNTGALHITDAIASQNSSSAIVNDFDNGAGIGGFDVTFDLYIGGGNGADGFSFAFGDFTDSVNWTEEGPGTMRGLSICWDVYNSGGTPPEAPAIDVKWNNTVLFHRLVGATGSTTPASPIGSATTIRSQTTAGGPPVYWPVKIHVDPDGTLDLVYNNVIIFTNIPVFAPFDPTLDPPVYGPAYRFGFGGRTGGSYDNHWIDNLKITTVPLDPKVSGQPSLVSVSPQPVGSNAGAAGGVEVIFTNRVFAIDQVVMRYGNGAVTPLVTTADGRTRIAYFGSNGVLPTGAGNVQIGYSTTSNPVVTNYFNFNFIVDPFSTLSTNILVASVDTSKPGFKYRVHQMDFLRLPGTDRTQIILAERDLANGYIDPATGQPYPNTADLTQVGADGYFDVPDVINFDYRPAAIGFFSSSTTPPVDDKMWPGIPGMGQAPPGLATDNFVAEFTGYIQLKAGGNRFGFNSDDGFKAVIGPGTDVAGTIVGSFNGGRGQGTPTLFDILVPQDGFYPIRILYFQGGGGADAEFFWIDPATGNRVLVNDPNNTASPRVYRESPVSRPFISRALPVQNELAAFPDQDVIIDITDGGLPLDVSKVSLYINNAVQNVTTSKNGKVTTIKRAGSLTDLLPSGQNNVRLEYGYTQAGSPVLLTNSYAFTVAPYYNAIPAANKVQTAADPGFTMFVTQMDKSGNANQGDGARINGGGDSNRMPNPEIQLAGGEINPTNGLTYPNLAQAGANSFNYDFDVVNWQFNNAAGDVAQSGWVQTSQPPSYLPGARPDVGVPGFPGTGTSYGGLENAVMEIRTYLQLKKGVTVLGFNSDDGFVATSAPDNHDTLGTLLGFFNAGRGNSGTLVGPTGQNPPQITPNVASGSTVFSVIVPEDGIYPVRILFWQGGTGFNAEFFSINKQNGQYFLVGDTDPAAIPAFRTYTGPARPWVKFSVSPNPWDNIVQQSGPGPIKVLGRTRNAANSSDIYNLQSTGYYVRPWADVAIGGVVANGTSEANLKLLVNGAVVPATLTTNGTDVTVSYRPATPLPPGSTNTAALVYAGTTNSWRFTVQPYQTLNSADSVAVSSADPNARGFKVKMAQTASVTPYTQNSVARAEAQLAGVLAPNLAIPGPGPDGSYIYTNIINWTNGIGTVLGLGNFQAAGLYGAGTGWPFPTYTDEPVPGVPGTGRSNADNSAAEVFAYLAFPTAGYYRMGVNSDDGFGVKIGTPGVTNGMALVTVDLGKGASDVPFSFVVPQPGLYPVRLIWYNGGGGNGLEFFSYDEAGNKIPVNDRNNPASIKAYYALTAKPTITNVGIVNGQINITWANGGTLESSPDLTTWTSTGDTDGSFSEPVGTANKFYRVK